MKIIKSYDNVTVNPHGFSVATDVAWHLSVIAMESNLLRVVLSPEGGLPDSRTWMVAPEGDVPWQGRDRNDKKGFYPQAASVIVESDQIICTAGQFRLTLLNNPVRLNVEQLHNGQWQPWIRDRETGGFALADGDRRVRHYQHRNNSDRHFGLGDKSGPIDRTGRRFRVLQLDALGYDAEIGDPLYKHIPYIAVQNGGISGGIFYDSLASSTFDLGCERSNYHGIYRYVEIEERGLDFWLIAGPDLAAVTRRFTLLTGRPAFAPRWSYGFGFTTMHHADDANAQQVISNFADRSRMEEIPLSSIHFGSGYSSRGKRRYVFTWNKQKFPDPKILFAKLDSMGIPTVANLKPVLIDDHPNYTALAGNGGFIKDEVGKPVLEQFWDGMGSYLDFTNEETVRWWQEGFAKHVLDVGFSAGWNDNNEYEIGRENSIAAGFGKPIDAPAVRPVHALLMTRSTYEASQKRAPLKRPYTITRAGPAGIQRYAETWTGDNATSWHTLRWNVANGLSLALSGQSKVGHDIGGFTGPRPDAELLCRWIEMMALHPRAVMNSWKPDVSPDWEAATTPWLYAEMMPAVRNALQLKTLFLPLVYAQGYRYHAVCEPIIRPLCYEFPNDQMTYDDNTSFMVGPNVLFAPVVEQGARQRTQYLPSGVGHWIEFHTGAVHAAGACVTVDAPLGRPPIFVREGAAIILAHTCPVERPYDAAARRIYLATASANAAGYGESFEDDGDSWDFRQNGGEIAVDFVLKNGNATVAIRAQNGALERIGCDQWFVDGPFVTGHSVNVNPVAS